MQKLAKCSGVSEKLITSPSVSRDAGRRPVITSSGVTVTSPATTSVRPSFSNHSSA
jgi:hypothetical protein